MKNQNVSPGKRRVRAFDRQIELHRLSFSLKGHVDLILAVLVVLWKTWKPNQKKWIYNRTLCKHLLWPKLFSNPLCLLCDNTFKQMGSMAPSSSPMPTPHNLCPHDSPPQWRPLTSLRTSPQSSQITMEILHKQQCHTRPPRRPHSPTPNPLTHMPTPTLHLPISPTSQHPPHRRPSHPHATTPSPTSPHTTHKTHILPQYGHSPTPPYDAMRSPFSNTSTRCGSLRMENVPTYCNHNKWERRHPLPKQNKTKLASNFKLHAQHWFH